MTIQDQLCESTINSETNENLLVILLIDDLTHKVMSRASIVGADKFDLHELVQEDMDGEVFDYYKETRSIKKMVELRDRIISNIKSNENHAALWMGGQDKWIMAIRPILEEHLASIDVITNKMVGNSRHRVVNVSIEDTMIGYDMTIQPDGCVLVNTITVSLNKDDMAHHAMMEKMQDRSRQGDFNLHKMMRVVGIMMMFDAACTYHETVMQ